MTDISKEAVERLATFAKDYVGWDKCADTLRALSARLAEVEAANRGLVRLNDATQNRAEAAEAKLAEVEKERDRQYDENVDRIAQQGAANYEIERVEAELSCREQLIKDHLRKIMHFENRVEDESVRAEAAEAKLAVAREALEFYGGVMPVSFSPGSDGGCKARQALATLNADTPAIPQDSAWQPEPEVRLETTKENIARDIREGRFPSRSEPEFVLVYTTPPPEVSVGEAASDESIMHAMHEQMCGCGKGIDCPRCNDYLIAFRAALRALAGEEG